MTNTDSIDSPEFRELLQDYVIRTPNGRTALIAHIDAKIAEAVKDSVGSAGAISKEMSVFEQRIAAQFGTLP